MAEIEVGDLVAKISFDDTGLNKSMAEINRQMKLVESEFDKASSALGDYGSEEDRLDEKTKSLNQQLQLQQQRVNKLNDEFQKSVREKGEDAAQTQKLATQLNKAQAEYNDLNNELVKTNRELDDQKSKLTGFQKEWSDATGKAKASMGGLFDSLKMAGTAITAAGAGISFALGGAVKSAADFEQSMSNVKAVMSPDEVQEFSGALTDLAQKLGADTKYSATEAAQGIEELVKAGVKTTDILNGGLAGALSLASAGDLELADAAEIASTALNAFKDDALSVQQAADLLAGAANASATSVGELKFGLAASASVAAGVGLSFADTATALAVFAQNGLKGSDAGTSLKTMLMNLQPHTDAAFNEFDRLGLMVVNTDKAMQFLASKGIKDVENSSDGVIDALATYLAQMDGAKTVTGKYFKDAKDLATQQGLVQSAFYDSAGSMRDMNEIADILQKSLDGMTDAQRASSLQILFGSDAIRAGNILYKEGAKGINDMAAAMSKVGANDVAAAKMDNLNGAIEQLSGSVETAKIAIGNALLPALKTVTEVVQSAVDWFNRLPDSIKQFIAIGSAVVGVLALIIGPLTLLIGFLPQIIAGFELLAPVFAALTGPIGLVVAAVAALVAGIVILYNKNEDFRKFVDTTWAAITKSIKTALDAIWAYLKSVIDQVIGFVMDQLGKLREFWKENGDDILSIVKFVFDQIVSNIKLALGIIKGLFQVTWPIIEGILKIAWETMKLAVSNAIDIIMGVIQLFIKVMKGDWKGAWETIETTVKNVWSNVETFLGNINLKEVGMNIIQGLIDGMGSMFSALKKKVSDIANSIPDGLKDLLGIHSPSKVTEQIGVWTGQGLALGMQKSLGAIAGQAAAMSAAAVPDPNVAGATTSPAGMNATAQAAQMVQANFYLDGKRIATAIAKPLADMSRSRARGLGMA